MVVMGRCDCCGVIHVLHQAGEYVICDECDKMLTPTPQNLEEEE